MTTKEMLIVKRLGYPTYSLYSYIKTNGRFRNKELYFDLGMSDQSRHRGFNVLKEYNVIKVEGSTIDREISILTEQEWRL